MGYNYSSGRDSGLGGLLSGDNLLLLVWFLVFIVVCCGVGAKRSKEGFWPRVHYPYRYCSNCGRQSKRSCSKCKNCGFCVPYNGRPECVPGDENGPYFRKDCMIWDYGNPKYYYPHLYPYGYWYKDGRWRYGRRRKWGPRIRRARRVRRRGGPHRMGPGSDDSGSRRGGRRVA